MKLSRFLIPTLLFGFFTTATISADAQCEITSDDSYLLTDDPATLTATPEGGFFAGPGVTGDIFDPGEAGEGVHTIYYVVPESGTGDIYYIQSNAGDPWGSPTNQTLMDIAFGPTSWNLEYFEALDAATIFAPATGFVYMDGGSMSADEMAIFLFANMTLIEDWVADGGRLFMNSAPNEGGNIDFGFGGTTLVYEPGVSYTASATVTDVGHPSLFGPELPTVVDMTGTYFAHGYITGTDLNTIVVNTDSPGDVVLSEKDWGAGRVMFGALVANNFQEPAVQVQNWRSNLLFGLYNDYCTKEITVGGYASIETDKVLEQVMYPNPATEMVQFQLIPETTVEIFSITGEQLLAPTLNLESFDVSTIEAGVYLVVFTNETVRTTQRLIVK
ncbi:MAG: T9SS type A sorting domain-containing protein [Crocinitomix sp.]|nr:T9SS type A sorting domain-containing protein [Crocinitomix sp.]